MLEMSDTKEITECAHLPHRRCADLSHRRYMSWSRHGGQVCTCRLEDLMRLVCPGRLFRQQWRCLHFTSRLGMLLRPFKLGVPLSLDRSGFGVPFARSGCHLAPRGFAPWGSVAQGTPQPSLTHSGNPSFGRTSKIPCLSENASNVTLGHVEVHRRSGQKTDKKWTKTDDFCHCWLGLPDAVADYSAPCHPI